MGKKSSKRISKARATKRKAPKKRAKSSPKPKIKKKRDGEKYPGLKKNLFSKVKQEYFDYDYIDTLSDKDKAWLSKFTQEYLGANLKEENKPMNKTKKVRKQIFDANNARQRDIYSIAKATGTIDFNENDLDNAKEDPALAEDKFIDALETDVELLEDFIHEINKKKT